MLTGGGPKSYLVVVQSAGVAVSSELRNCLSDGQISQEIFIAIAYWKPIHDAHLSDRLGIDILTPS
jgi:hypothetical protein